MNIKRIYLTGFMGSGKSTVGRILGDRLNLTFTDLDELIVEREGLSIPDIFEQLGEPAFRKKETEALEVCSTSEGVFGLGGGAVLDGVNRSILLSSGLLIYLMATPDTLARRLEFEVDERPLLAGEGSLVNRIDSILAQRRQIYELAHWKIETDELTPEQVADKIVHRIEEGSGD